MLPTIKWSLLMVRNPSRKWWQFWRPKKIRARDALINNLTTRNSLYAEMDRRHNDAP